MSAAIRKAPTQANGGPDDGIGYPNAVNNEVLNLWRVSAEWLDNVAGTPNAIVATSDTNVVSAVLSTARPKAFWLIPAATNTGAATIAIDGLPVVNIVDADGNALVAGALVLGRITLLVSDGTSLRIVSGSGSSTAVASSVLINNGRLSNQSGLYTPVGAVTGATQIFWTIGDNGNQISLFDGVSAWTTISSPEKSIKVTDTQTGNTHNGTRTIDGLTDTSQFIPGMKISGTGVGAGAVISSVDSPTQVTSSVNGTSSATNSITFKLAANLGVDVYGQNVSNALKLFFVARSAIFTATANTKQDGITVNAANLKLRWLGWFMTSNTDGQVDYTALGQYRFFNLDQDNRLYRKHMEGFSSSGTYFRSPCTVRITIDVAGGGGSTTDGSHAGGAGGQSAFAGFVSAAGGAGGNADGSQGADGNGSAGDINIPAGGAFGAGNGGFGGRGLRSVYGASLSATAAVTVGAGGTLSGVTSGKPGWLLVDEVMEI